MVVGLVKGPCACSYKYHSIWNQINPVGVVSRPDDVSGMEVHTRYLGALFIDYVGV